MTRAQKRISYWKSDPTYDFVNSLLFTHDKTVREPETSNSREESRGVASGFPALGYMRFRPCHYLLASRVWQAQSFFLFRSFMVVQSKTTYPKYSGYEIFSGIPYTSVYIRIQRQTHHMFDHAESNHVLEPIAAAFRARHNWNHCIAAISNLAWQLSMLFESFLCKVILVSVQATWLVVAVWGLTQFTPVN